MKVISPIDSKPTTHDLTDELGMRKMVVMPKELTPLRAKTADTFALLCAIAFFIFMIIDPYNNIPIPSISDIPSFLVALVVLIAGTCGSYLLSKYILRDEFTKGTTIEFTAEHLKVKTLFGYKCYDRLIPHKFLLLQHDKTLDEQRSNEDIKRRAAMNGRIANPYIYYEDSFHVVFEYMGQRIDLLEVFGHKPARTVLARLMLCDQLMDSQLKNSNGATMRIEDQWQKQPGEIIQDPKYILK